MDMVAAEVEKVTQEGTDYLKQGNLEDAQKSFQAAFDKAEELSDDFIGRACAFNLGAVHIALHNPLPGLELLHSALPSSEVRDGRSNGDLYFNFGVAHELLQNDIEAARYYELSLEEYQKEKSNWEMEAEVGMKLGSTYSRSKNDLQAARGYGVAATAYARCQMHSEHALSLSKQATSLLQASRPSDALRAADDSILLCQKAHQTEEFCVLYHDLGLVYTQCHEFARAATCFELALPLCGQHGKSSHRAVILQNLGAAYNSMHEYHHAVGFHEAAATLHGELRNRGEQGQCFINQGFARSQLGDMNAAGESYLHALQAATDAGDFRGQWQSLEGLGAVAFNQENIDLAVERFKEALTRLSSSPEQNRKAQERIVSKLANTLRYQLGTEPESITLRKTASLRNGQVSDNKKVDILVNSLPRPPTRQESRQMKKLRMERKVRLQSIGRHRSPSQSHIKSLALGIGEYDSDSDYSLSDHAIHKKRHLYATQRSKSGVDTVDRPKTSLRRRSSSVGEVDQHRYARRSSSRKFKGLGLGAVEGMPEWDEQMEETSVSSVEPRKSHYTSMDVGGGDGASDSDEESMGQDDRKRRRSSRDRLKDQLLKAIQLKRLKRKLKSGKKLDDADQDMDGRDEKLTEQNLTEYEKQLCDMEIDSSDSDTDSESTSDDTSRDRLPPTLPDQPPPSLGINTYLKPVQPSENYFSVSDTKTPEKALELDERKHLHVDDNVKFPTTDSRDPTYMTIGSLKPMYRITAAETEAGTSEPKPGTSTDQPPPLPPRQNTDGQDFESMSRAEQEEFLYTYQRMRDENKREQVMQMQQEEGGMDLPRKGRRAKNSSRMCALM